MSSVSESHFAHKWISIGGRGREGGGGRGGGVSEPWGNASGWEEYEEEGGQQDEEEETSYHIRGVDRNAGQFCLRQGEREGGVNFIGPRGGSDVVGGWVAMCLLCISWRLCTGQTSPAGVEGCCGKRMVYGQC